MSAAILAVLMCLPAAPASAEEPSAQGPVVEAVLADMNAQERWLYDAYASDPDRLKALQIRGSQVDLGDKDDKRKFLADTRKKVVAFAEREYQFNGGELAMLSGVLVDPSKADGFKQEVSKLDPCDKAAQLAFMERRRKEIASWAAGYVFKERTVDAEARSVEEMVGADERAVLEQARRNDENNFKVRTFTSWVQEADRKLAAGKPGAQKRALELVAMARNGMKENMQKYLDSPEIAKLLEPVKPESSLVSASTSRELLEKAEQISRSAASAESPEAMFAQAGTSFSGGLADGETLADALAAGPIRDTNRPADAVSAEPVSQKGLTSREVPAPSGKPAQKSALSGASGWLAPGLGALGLGLIGLVLLGPLGALLGAGAGLFTKGASGKK
ncbi:MAG: hypothetical protein HY922_04790 [Elusimicrobia bacterium]|nr:hypothetical protein [Elusimicrobiota bacterium]